MTAETTSQRLPDMLVLAQEEWDEVERRNQLLVRALADRHPATHFLFAERPLRPREVRQWRRPRLRRVARNVWAFQPMRPFPGHALRGASDRAEAAQINAAARAAGLCRPLLWTQDPRAATLLDVVGHDGLVYDLTDDWATFETEPEARAAIEHRVRTLGEAARLTLACSAPLSELALAWTTSPLHVANAIDPLTEPADVPADLALLPRPRLGYVGTAHSSRLDVELLAGAAKLRPSWSFVLLGPEMLEVEDRRRLLSLANVSHLGVRPHSQVRAHLEGLDVCLLPHRVNDFTRSLDPLKLYEYLAAGRPVIATPLGNAPELDEHVNYVESAPALVEAAERLLEAEEPACIADRRAAVADATWEARAAEIEGALGVVPVPFGDGVVDVVIVSYNTRELLLRCLADVEAQDGVGHHAIVVDNASTDGSVDAVRRSFPAVEVIELSSNRGFGAANNIAFERCTHEFVLLLNSDAFLEPGALAELVAAARRHPRAGAIGPRLLNEDGTLQRSAWPFPRAGRLVIEAIGAHRALRRLGLLEDFGTWRHDAEQSVDFLVGACLLLRAAALEDVVGFNEAFWFYAEEADLQRRLHDHGWHVVLTPTAAALHVGGASSTQPVTRWRNFYRGQRRYLQTHGSTLAWPVAWVALVIGAALRGRRDVLRAAFSLDDARPA